MSTAHARTTDRIFRSFWCATITAALAIGLTVPATQASPSPIQTQQTSSMTAAASGDVMESDCVTQGDLEVYTWGTTEYHFIPGTNVGNITKIKMFAKAGLYNTTIDLLRDNGHGVLVTKTVRIKLELTAKKKGIYQYVGKVIPVKSKKTGKKSKPSLNAVYASTLRSIVGIKTVGKGKKKHKVYNECYHDTVTPYPYTSASVDGKKAGITHVTTALSHAETPVDGTCTIKVGKNNYVVDSTVAFTHTVANDANVGNVMFLSEAKLKRQMTAEVRWTLGSTKSTKVQFDLTKIYTFEDGSTQYSATPAPGQRALIDLAAIKFATHKAGTTNGCKTQWLAPRYYGVVLAA